MQSFGPSSVNVILPPAAAPFVALMLVYVPLTPPFVPGCVAVPLSVALSWTACPKLTDEATAWVSRPGVTGSTSKHSPVRSPTRRSSRTRWDAGGAGGEGRPPAERPTEVNVTAFDVYAPFVVTVDQPAATPPVEQVPVAIGPQMKNASVPV